MRNLTDKTTTVHVNILRDTLDRFDRLYPSTRRRFIQNALDMACNSRETFDKIFFRDILAVDGDYNNSI